MGGFVSANRLCSARLKNTAKQALKRNETLMPSRQTPAEIAEDILEKKRQSIPSKINISGYSEAYQELAVVISKSTHSWQKREKQITQIVKRLSTSEEHNPWRNQEGMKLAHLLFGDLRAPFIANIWDSFSNLPYQSSWSRRSFRTNDPKILIRNALNHLSEYYVALGRGFKECSFIEELRFCGHNYYNCHHHMLAAALNQDSPHLAETITDIINGEDEIGVVSQDLIKTLLLSDNTEHWALVKNLLLAAQRQEGLRQTILESLDETSVPALCYIIEVIIEHDLARFSSVVRAVDTWFGFGWEAPKKAVINKVLTDALSFIDEPSKVTEAAKGKDHLSAYVALWATALKDIDVANRLAIDVFGDEASNKSQKLRSLFFLQESGRTNSSIIPFMTSAWGQDIEIDYWALQSMPNFDWPQSFFDQVKASADSLPASGKNYSSDVFAWKSYTIRADQFYERLIEQAQEPQLQRLGDNLASIPNDMRVRYMYRAFGDNEDGHYGYRSNYAIAARNKNEKAIKKQITLEYKDNEWRRKLIQQAIADRNIDVMTHGFDKLFSLALNDEEIALIIHLLARKSNELRTRAIFLLSLEPFEKLQTIVTSLLSATKELQRVAGLELLNIFKENLDYLGDKNNSVATKVENKEPVVEPLKQSFIKDATLRFGERSKHSKNETVWLNKLMPSDQANMPSYENGFDAIDYSKLSPLMEPEAQIVSEKSLKSLFKNKQKAHIASLVDSKKLVKQVNKLIDLYQQNINFEYAYEGYFDSTEHAILADGIHLTKQPRKGESELDYLPLAETWKRWYEESQLNDLEVYYAVFFLNVFGASFSGKGDMRTFIKRYYPEVGGLNVDLKGGYQSLNSKIHVVLAAIESHYCDLLALAEFKIRILEDMLHSCPTELRTKVSGRSCGWIRAIQATNFNTLGIEYSKLLTHKPALLKRYYDIQFFMFVHLLAFPNQPQSPLDAVTPLKIHDHYSYQNDGIDIELSYVLYNAGMIPAEDLLFQALNNTRVFSAIDSKCKKLQDAHFNKQNLACFASAGEADSYNRESAELDEDKLLKLAKLLQQLKSNLLHIELERGELSTPASPYIVKFSSVDGISHLINVLSRFDKETLERGYYYYSDSKKATFSHIIRHCRPHHSESYEDFNDALQRSTISKKRLIEVACYAPQWAQWIGQHLRINNLGSAIWWFHAHASDYMTAQKETEIARFSTITKSEFEQGAIDIFWFQEVYQQLGKTNWKLLHDAAKYVSDGNGHRRVKLYSSVMLGEVKITETIKKVEDKRDKDYLRALGLIPLSKKVPEKDLLKRYNLIQIFLKESKQFGAQRQESERNACEIALDNLARNAGFGDRVRFEWAMEGKATEAIMQNDRVDLDSDVSVSLLINELGKPELVVVKGGKTQKSIPAKYKKDKRLATLKDAKNYLTKQYSRTKKSLENAMLRSDAFSLSEFGKISDHPIVSAMLRNLVIFNASKKQLGFFKAGELITPSGEKHSVADQDQLMIAHCSHLHASSQWHEYQSYLFTEQIVQVFKQVFRELYLITEDEKERAYRSERYQGHQIQPAKTVALLRGRGWTVSYDEGLQKVFHQHGIMATMYAAADWFTPADIEAPTLEYVCFYSLKNNKALNMADVPPVLFSEVMRDVDLVVSVAHVGEVDPEASHSTMEMRKVLAEESARLFKLNNVEVKDRHILISGKHGEYSLHLGSANVQKQGLAIHIVAVQSQHRGRMFLPFVDDDPKSAELISKMKLLAEDDKLKDPTMLRQLSG
jgi:hypothetical protein